MNGTYADIAELKAMKQNMVACAVAARALGMSDQSLRVCARQRPDLLIVEPHIYGSRVMFSRLQLIRALEGWSLEDVPDNQLLAEALRRLPAGTLDEHIAMGFDSGSEEPGADPAAGGGGFGRQPGHAAGLGKGPEAAPARPSGGFGRLLWLPH